MNENNELEHNMNYMCMFYFAYNFDNIVHIKFTLWEQDMSKISNVYITVCSYRNIRQINMQQA